jgi:hypothetical protein
MAASEEDERRPIQVGDIAHTIPLEPAAIDGLREVVPDAPPNGYVVYTHSPDTTCILCEPDITATPEASAPEPAP